MEITFGSSAADDIYEIFELESPLKNYFRYYSEVMNYNVWHMHVLQGDMAPITHENTEWTLVFLFCTYFDYCNGDRLAEIRVFMGMTLNLPS